MSTLDQKNEIKRISFEEIIQQHKGILYKVSRTYCPQQDEHQDLIQEMMIQVWKSLPKYDPAFNISTWLYRIAINVAISYYRKSTTKKKNFEILNSQHEPKAEEDEKTEQEHQFILLEQFIFELKELDKALILLYLEDKNHADIADILGISISNVGTKINRIKEKLKTRFLQIK